MFLFLTTNTAAVTLRANQQYSQLSLRWTPLGLTLSVCLRKDVRLIESQI